MPLISITRLHLRSARFLPPFLFYTLRSTQQVRAARGFFRGWTSSEWALGFWTATAWSDLDAMRAFRNGEPHLTAMRKLLQWCDEASYVHWQQESAELPVGRLSFEQMRQEGKQSKVAKPSPRHAEGATVGDAVPKPGAVLRSKA